MNARGLQVERQVPISIAYKEMTLKEALRADLLVGGKVIVKLKSIEQINNAHRKQVQTYLRLAGRKLGYLLDFGAALM